MVLTELICVKNAYDWLMITVRKFQQKYRKLENKTLWEKQVEEKQDRVESK